MSKGNVVKIPSELSINSMVRTLNLYLIKNGEDITGFLAWILFNSHMFLILIIVLENNTTTAMGKSHLHIEPSGIFLFFKDKMIHISSTPDQKKN